MEQVKLRIIESGVCDRAGLTEAEKEIALKILNDFSGTLVVRAKVILDFCKDAIDYSVVKF